MAVLTLFSADLDDPSLSDAGPAGCLTVMERARAGRYARPELVRRFMAGRVIMRYALGRLLDVRPADVPIVYNAWGKPELSGGPFFNLSHAGRSALFAIDELAPVGVDIEIDDPAAEQGWFDAILSARERAELDASRPTISTLLRLWVRKEAIMKAVGCGFSLAPDKLNVGLKEVDRHNWQLVENSAHSGPCPIVFLDLPDCTMAALARMGEPPMRFTHAAITPIKRRQLFTL